MPKAGEFYRHFKNKLYQIVAVAKHSETGEMLVIYQALYGSFEIYARPLEMFLSEVDHEKYPEITQKYRFERVDLTESQNETVSKQPIAEEVVTAAKEWQTNTEVISSVQEERPDVGLLEFLDEDDWEKKYHILVSLRDKMNDRLIDNLATAIDVVIPDGPIDDRYEQLKSCVRTRQRYESLHSRLYDM